MYQLDTGMAIALKEGKGSGSRPNGWDKMGIGTEKGDKIVY